MKIPFASIFLLTAAAVFAVAASFISPSGSAASAPFAFSSGSAASAGAGIPTPETLTPFVSALDICGALSYDGAGNLYISEWSARRVGIYNARGELADVINGIGDPSGNAFDSEGNFYVSSYSYGCVWKISPDRKKSIYADGFTVPAGLAWIDGRLHVCNRDAGEVVRIEKNGRKTVLARGLPQPVAVMKLKDGACVISCLAGSPRILESDGTLSVLIPEIKASGINIIPDGENSFLFCVISDGTVERVTLGGTPKKRTVTRTVLARGFSTPIGIARCPDGNVIFDAWGQGAAYIITVQKLQ